MIQNLGLILVGLIAGFIDSIAGGGGLITLPTFGILLGPGVDAIGTNKIAGVAAAGVAYWVYTRKHRPDWRTSFSFAAMTAVGSWVGSRISPSLPPELFKAFLLITCPLVLGLVWTGPLWKKSIERQTPHLWQETPRERGFRLARIGLAALLCGLYDGVWGPGGGTLMLLTTLMLARMPLFTALASSKLANTASAGTALVSYGFQGHVHFWLGLPMGIGIAAGAFWGASLASRRASTVVRPVLTVAVLLLLTRVLFFH